MHITYYLPHLLSLALASPTPITFPDPNRVAAVETTSSVIPTSDLYYLKTRALPGNDTSKSNLYVQSYHTGAGTNDVVLVPKSAGSLAEGFLNDTRQQFELSGTSPWGFYPEFDDYSEWAPVFLNAGEGFSGFYFNDTDGSGVKGLKYNSEYQYDGGSEYNAFSGWLVCDWAHGLPQLFWLELGIYKTTGNPFGPTPIPSSCAQVELLREFIA